MNEQRASRAIEGSPSSLAELNLSNETLDTILRHVGRLSLLALPGWDAAATTLVEENRVATYGSTEPRIEEVDQYQYDLWSGPCVDALNGDIQYLDGKEVPEKWEPFHELISKIGINSVLSFPLHAGGDVIGALNFYSENRDPIESGNLEEGQAFAAQASVALAAAKGFQASREQVKQLEEAIQTRTMIGQATGLLMAQEGLTSQEAFQKLVHVSQTSNIKLREIAQRYVNTWEEKADREPQFSD
jgi:GAF domain-containing protein